MPNHTLRTTLTDSQQAYISEHGETIPLVDIVAHLGVEYLQEWRYVDYHGIEYVRVRKAQKSDFDWVY